MLKNIWPHVDILTLVVMHHFIYNLRHVETGTDNYVIYATFLFPQTGDRWHVYDVDI